MLVGILWALLAGLMLGLYCSGRLSLYNVVEDRAEQLDLADRHPEKVGVLVDQLKAWETEMGVAQYSGMK